MSQTKKYNRKLQKIKSEPQASARGSKIIRMISSVFNGKSYLFGLLMLTFTAFALETPPAPKQLTLHDAVWLSLRYNPNIKNAEVDRVVQKYNLVVAKNQFELQYALNAATNYNYSKSDGFESTSTTTTLTPSTSLNLPSGASVNAGLTNTLNGGNTNGTYNPSMTVNITQPLMRGFGSAVTLTPLANAYDAERINKLNLRETIIATITKVVGDYYTVIENQQNLITQKLAVDDVTKRLQQNQIKIKAGKIPPSDIVQAQADLAQAQLGYTSAENTLLQSKLTLLNDIGLAPNENIVIDTNLADTPDPLLPTLDDTKKLVLANDTAYQTSLINYHVDERGLKVAQDNERAQLNLTVSGTTGSSSGDGSNSGIESLTNGSNQNAAIGLSLSVPIDDVTTKQATLSAKAKLQEDNINIRNQEWTLETSAINNLSNITTLKKQLDIAKTAVDAQSKALELANIKRKYGLGSQLDVSIQQTALTTARLNYTNTKISYLNAMLQFRQLLGKTLEDWGVEVRY